ncbi:hypothetical protein FB1_12090 [Flavobacterium branchiophilum NBRC 15030 = ATCC 35035]|uniref:Uncharacterized protein n=1 Tax=Flavobacterium branchiophilum TaxID=55197 RepID=A0A543G5T7_9FLAO|nr:hypothetical protein BC670_2340 [Flavobacterium branchiophilum]GEM54988.1 hypothetical protein FB1_12090 [Flavobacterium branchiophilum NBRC 15030 = ATCC 35035]
MDYKHFLGTISTIFFNQNFALDFVMKSKNTRKLSAHGLFKILEYINILTFKKGDIVD